MSTERRNVASSASKMLPENDSFQAGHASFLDGFRSCAGTLSATIFLHTRP